MKPRYWLLKFQILILPGIVLYRNDTCLYTILLADPILGERELCMSIAQFTVKSVATELCEYMWILCFLIVTKKMCF